MLQRPVSSTSDSMEQYSPGGRQVPQKLFWDISISFVAWELLFYWHFLSQEYYEENYMLPFFQTGVYIFNFNPMTPRTLGKNMVSHDLVKNTPQRNGEGTWMENELLQSKLKQKFISLMKMKGNLNILQSCQLFFLRLFSVLGRNI